MVDRQINPKEPLRSILLHQRQKCKDTLDFYERLMQEVPEDEALKYHREAPFHDELGGLVPSDIHSPISMLETAIQTIDEYLVAIDSFTDDQLAAFFLGLGFTSLPIRYWGVQELYDYYAKIQRTIAFYERLLSEVPEGEHWKYEKSGVFDLPLGLVPPDSLPPTDILKKARELVEGMLAVLTDRPF